MIDMAKQAAAAWGSATDTPRLISHRENAVFQVTLNDGKRAALRLHRPGYNSVAEIEAELWWTHALADLGFPAPKPLQTLGGDYLTHLPDGQVATAISWVSGAPIGETSRPLDGALAEQIALYRDLGGLLARLHSDSDALRLPADFQRRSWDSEGFLGAEPLWGRFWENPALDARSVKLVQTARAAAIAQLRDYAKTADYGLIHADALRENVFRDAGGLTLIDFDDAGFGFRMYDLTTALSQSVDDANFWDLKEAILAGYSETRGITKRDVDLFPLFTMLRTFASLGWVVPRLPADHAGMPRYIRRAEQAARRYLETT